jgi:hypothetical protein
MDRRDGIAVAFTRRGVRRVVTIIGRWHLRERWWQPWERESDCQYFNPLTADHQCFAVYRGMTNSADAWVLDQVQD